MEQNIQFSAVGKNLVVKVLKRKEEEKKGVLLLNTTQPWDHVERSEILSVGSAVQAGVNKGDVIITRMNMGVPIAPADDKMTIRVIDESDILVKIQS